MPITIDPTVNLPVSKKSDGNPLNDPKWIDPNTPLVYGPGSGRIISSSAAHRNRDLSYKTWNPELNEYEDISKFSKYGVMFSEYGPSWQEQRARGQSTGEKWSRGLRKAAITTGGAIVENTLGIVAGLGSLASGGQYHNNEVGKMVDGWNEWARSEMPNYYTQKERDAGVIEGLASANFWADKVANGFGYTIGSLATAYLTGGYGLIGLGGKALNMTSKAATIAKANKIHKLYKTAQGTKRGDKLLGMYNKVTGTQKLKNGLLTLEAGAMMSLAESSVEARETQKHIKKQLTEEAMEKYPDGLPESVIKEINDLSEAAGNSSFVSNMAILSLSNVGMFHKFLAGTATKTSLKGLSKTAPKTITDKGSATFLGRMRTRTRPLRRGMAIEALQEGGQYATNIASTEFYTSRFDNKGGITLMQAVNEGLSRTLGEKEGLESMLIGAIVGGVSSGVTSIGQTKQRNELAKKIQGIVNDDAFMNIIDRTQANAATSHYLDKSDKYRAEGKDKLADQAMTQAFINHITTLDNAGALNFFTERLEDFKSLSDVEFKELFGFTEDQVIDKASIINNMIEETTNIVKRKDALDELFPEETRRGLPARLLGKKGKEEEKQKNLETRILKAQLLHQAVFLDQIENSKKSKAREIDKLFPGITQSILEEQVDLATEEYDKLIEQYIRNAAAAGQVDEDGNVITNVNQIPESDRLDIHNQAYRMFIEGTTNSVKNVNLTHPLDKDAINAQLSEYYMEHRDLQDLMESWNRLQTNEGRQDYIRAALIDGEQSIKDANNRRADDILDNESDPNTALNNMPPGISKTKKAEIEEEVKRMKKVELALIDKYGDPNISLQDIDSQIETLKQRIEENKKSPRVVKMANFELQVLETIKQVKLSAENTINEKETKEKVGKKVEPKTEKTGRGRRQIDRIKKNYETAETPSDKLNIIQKFINNVYQGAEATQEEIDFFNNEIEALKKEGFELDMNFQPGVQWNEGDIVEIVASIPDENLPLGIVIINHVDSPGIIKDGKGIKRASVTTRVGTKEGTGREELVKEENKAADIPGTGKKKLDAIKKAKKARNEFDNQFRNPFNLADLASKETTVSTKTEATPIDKTEYEIHLEGNYAAGGWQILKQISAPGVEIGDVRNYSNKQIDFIEQETDDHKIFTIIDKNVRDHVGRPGGTSVSMVFPKDTLRTLADVRENLLTLNAEIQAAREEDKFTNFAISKIQRMDLKEIATPDINIETVIEKNTSTEEVIVVEELNPIEEDRLKSELETDMHKDLSIEQSEVDQIPIGEMQGYMQQLQEEEAALLKRLEEEDDNCK
tara:strand:- start:2080 stop:6015 length:3936 start_codon:yes stop_codon:yes gene_type:complete